MANGVMVTNRNMEIVLHNPALMRLLEISEKIESPISVSKLITDNNLLNTLNRIQSRDSSENAFVSQQIKSGKNFSAGLKLISSL